MIGMNADGKAAKVAKAEKETKAKAETKAEEKPAGTKTTEAK